MSAFSQSPNTVSDRDGLSSLVGNRSEGAAARQSEVLSSQGRLPVSAIYSSTPVTPSCIALLLGSVTV
ncbi:hypothetical protein KCV06_g504, partial [Aureobasidium melanogenum]